MTGDARAALRPAYLATRYLVHHAGGTVEARVGEPAAALDALLAAAGAARGTFLTADNPGSERRSAEENAAAARRLAAALAAAGYRPLPHEGVALDGEWRERGFFVLGLGGDEALRWAERFGQYALVEAASGRAPALRFTRLAAGAAAKTGELPD
jgi:hypothetical protein